MLDFNETEKPSPRYDLDEICRLLASSAPDWAPSLFPNARNQNGELRLADISGRAPRKSGSCVVQLRGPNAGCWHDFSLPGSGGGPIDTIAQSTGLDGPELYQRAAEIAGINGYARPKRPQWLPPSRADATDREIAIILDRCQPLAGTLGEAYLASRGLSDPKSPDLIYNPDITDWSASRSRPAMIAIIRTPDGQRTGGIHRTYLRDDGAGKADCHKPKMMLGPVQGGVVMLASIRDATLGIAEGIESALAASILYGVPVWAGLSDSGVAGFRAPPECRRLMIFSDAGDAGARAAAACAAGNGHIETIIIHPIGGDDFADDLARRLGANPLHWPVSKYGREEIEQPITGPDGVVEPGTMAHLASLIAGLNKSSSPTDISDATKAAAQLRLNKVSLDAIVDRISRASGMKRASIQRLIKDESHELRAGSAMALDDDGNPVRCVYNAICSLRRPEWSIGWNLFDLSIYARGIMPWEPQIHGKTETRDRKWQDLHDIMASAWLQQQGIFVSSGIAHEAAIAVANENHFHPVIEYIDGQKWDATTRIEQWLTRVFGCPLDPYHRAIASKILIAAVRRVRKPGCKFDCMLILEGAEGIMKSTAIQTLFGSEWFTDQMPGDIGGAEASKSLAGKWGIEFGEIEQLLRTEPEAVLSFLSRQVDHYRPSYGRTTIDQPRQCVIFATTNKTGDYLRSEAGNRRFWPALCLSEGRADIEWLVQNRDQLWAEAAHAEALGATIWLDDDAVLSVAREQQRARLADDSWDGIIARHVDTIQSPTTAEILSGALSVPIADHSKAAQMRVGVIMRRLGWDRLDKKVNGTTLKVWIKKVAT